MMESFLFRLTSLQVIITKCEQKIKQKATWRPENDQQQQVETGGLFTIKRRELAGIRCAGCGLMLEGSLLH